jgi:SAM-dependent methyltransferase
MLTTLKGLLRRRLPWLPGAVQNARALARRRRFALMSTRGVFADIYKRQLWGGGETVSGDGSTLAYTEALRTALPSLLARLGVRTLVDIPCGDFNWMRKTELDLDQYIGADIVPELIAKLQREHAAAKRRFMVLDVVTDVLPAADAVMCRDCLIHLSNADAVAALGNIRRSGARWLLSTTYPEVAVNADIVTGWYRPLNLCLPPFNLPPPSEMIREPLHHRSIGVWALTPGPATQS